MKISGHRRGPGSVQGYQGRPASHLTGNDGQGGGCERRGRRSRLARQPRQSGDVEATVGLRPVLMRGDRLRDHGVTDQLTHVVIAIVATAGIVAVVAGAVGAAIGAANRTDAVDRVFGRRQGRQVERVRVIQALRQVVDAQLGVVERMPMRRRGRRCRLMMRRGSRRRC